MAKVAKRRGRYVLDFYDNQGKRRWITMPEGSTKKKAREVLREIEGQISRGVYLPNVSIPKFSDVAEDWLVFKRSNIRESTWGMYEIFVRSHFKELNDIKINRITTAGVEKSISMRLNKGMNISTLKRWLTTINQIMNYAVRHGFIEFNPVRDAERPRGKGTDIDEKIKILSPTKINALLDVVDDKKIKMLFMLAIMTRARQGEILGLKWVDVDWFNRQLNIKRTYNHGRWYQPKSKTSTRKIDLGPTVLKELKNWHKDCPTNELDLIFPNNVGKPMDQSRLLKFYFHPTLRKARIQRMRFHDLRHTYASLMIHQGENIKYIQNQLGHSSPTVTLNVYAHLMNNTNQDAAKRLDQAVFEPNGSKMVATNEKRLRPNAATT